MKVFIAGSITNRIDTYREVFGEAEKRFLQEGCYILSPTMLPDDGYTNEEYCHITKAMIDVSQIVYVLSGSEDSVGTQTELQHVASLNRIYPKVLAIHEEDMKGFTLQEYLWNLYVEGKIAFHVNTLEEAKEVLAETKNEGITTYMTTDKIDLEELPYYDLINNNRGNELCYMVILGRLSYTRTTICKYKLKYKPFIVEWKDYRSLLKK